MSLPRPLLELAWVRLNAATILEHQHVPRAFAKHPRFLQANRLVRRMHAAAMAEPASLPPPMTFAPYDEGGKLDLSDASFLSRGSRRVRVEPPKQEQIELKNRLNELFRLPVLAPEEAAVEDGPVDDGPPLTEEQLRAIYVDLLAAPAPDPDAIAAPQDPASRLELVEALEARLTVIMNETWRGGEMDGGLAATLLALRKRLSASETEQADAPPATHSVVDTVTPDAPIPLDVHSPDATPSDSSPTLHTATQDSIEPDTADPAVALEAPALVVESIPRPAQPVLAPTVADLDMSRPWNRVVAQLNVMLDRWQQDGVIVTAAEPDSPTSQPEFATEKAQVLVMPIGLSVVTLSDWTNVLCAAIDASDVAAGDVTLQLMERARVPVNPELRCEVLNLHARAGDVDAVESFIERHCPNTALEEKHLHVKAYARGGRQADACVLLHKYESDGHILPMKAYQSIIACLLYALGPGESQRRAQAWDLFAHMRYVAHPQPDVKLYSTMIRACSLRRGESDAERAMDLWTEMTLDQGMEPDLAAYNAVILACARNNDYLLEAFRLARTMMDSSRDATGVPHLFPDYHTFMALLQAGKRMGALARVRWLFAEIVRMAHLGQLQVNGHIMQQVFHTYATYAPPSRRPTLVAKRVQPTHMETVPASGSEVVQDPTPSPVSDDAAVGPPGRAEVLAEVQTLFERIVTERAAGSGLLSTVEITAMVGNSYLAVFINHCPLDRAMEAFRRVFVELGIPSDGRTYCDLMIRARTAVREKEQGAVEHAWDIFSEWQRKFGAQALTRRLPFASDTLDGTTDPEKKESSPLNVCEMTELMWTTMIETLAFAGQLDDAMTLVRRFEHMYPPRALRNALPPSPLRGMTTNLTGLRPLVRLSSTTQVADDTVQPMMLFKRVHVLHQRLLLKERHKDIKHLTWLTSAYEGNVLMRRDAMWGRERWQVKARRLEVKASQPPMLTGPVFKKGDRLTEGRKLLPRCG